MKKLFMVVGLLALFAGVSRAGVAFDNGYAPASFGSSIIGSTFTVSGGTQGNLTTSILPGSISSGGQTVSCRNCFTKFVVQMSTNVTINFVDQIPGGLGTTNYVISGIGLGTSGVNTLALPEDHLGPLCYPAGDTTLINAVAATPTFVIGNPINVNFEGYTYCGVAYNKNQ